MHIFRIFNAAYLCIFSSIILDKLITFQICNIMKKNYFLLFFLSLIMLFACSDDSEKILYEDIEVKIKDGYIESPAWLRDAVQESMTIAPNNKEILHGCVKAIQYDKKTYIIVEDLIRSSLCAACRIFQEDGTPVPCESDLHSKIFSRKRDESKEHILWDGWNNE